MKQRKMRSKNYDYSQDGYYFVTICTHNRQKLFEPHAYRERPACRSDYNLRVVPSNSPQNNIIEKWLMELENKFDNVKIGEYVIMSDHIHFILIKNTKRHNHITMNENAMAVEHTGSTLCDIIQWFKTMTTNEYIKMVKNNMLEPFDTKIWQRSYYGHIIYSEKEYMNVVKYILNNPK